MSIIKLIHIYVLYLERVSWITLLKLNYYIKKFTACQFLQPLFLCAVAYRGWGQTGCGKGWCWPGHHACSAWWHLPQIKIWRLHVTLDTLRSYDSQSSMKFKRSHPCNDTILVLLILYILGWNFPLKHYELESTWCHCELYQTYLMQS